MSRDSFELLVVVGAPLLGTAIVATFAALARTDRLYGAGRWKRSLKHLAVATVATLFLFMGSLAISFLVGGSRAAPDGTHERDRATVEAVRAAEQRARDAFAASGTAAILREMLADGDALNGAGADR